MIKSFCHIIVFTVIIFVWSCGLKPPVHTPTGTYGPAGKLFLRAEKMYRAGSFEKALLAFNEYLSRFPDEQMAPAALMKTGDIYTAMGKFIKAQNIYERLLIEYPDSSLIPTVYINQLTLFYKQGEYEKVIDKSAEYLLKPFKDTYKSKMFAIVGDTYMAIGSPADAVNYYAMAHDKSNKEEKNGTIAKLQHAAEQLSSSEISYLLNRFGNSFPAGYLMYRQALNKAGEGKYDEALNALSDFIKNFPQHPYGRQVRELIVEINKKQLYNRYTIGCLLPLSGRYKTYGNKALKGIEIALNLFTLKENKPPVRIIVKDTKSDPLEAAKGVIALYDENVAAIIGPIITAESAAVEAQKKKIPIITLTQKENITKTGDYVFRNFFTPSMQIKSLISYMLEDIGIKNFAILYPDENYGKTFMNLFWNRLIERGGKVVGVESYSPDSTDFADPIKKLVGLYYEIPEELKKMDMVSSDQDIENMNDIPMEPDLEDTNGLSMVKEPESPDETSTMGGAESDNKTISPDSKDGVEAETTGETSDEPGETEKDKAIDENEEEKEPEAIVDFDGIFIPDSPQKAGLIIPQLAFYDVKDIYLLGTNLWHSEKLIEMAQQYVQGAVMPDSFCLESRSEPVKNFIRIYRDTFNEKPEFISAVAYDTATLLFKIVGMHDIRFRSTLKNELLKTTDFEGITGRTSFGSDGDVIKKLYILQIKGKHFVELEQR